MSGCGGFSGYSPTKRYLFRLDLIEMRSFVAICGPPKRHWERRASRSSSRDAQDATKAYPSRMIARARFRLSSEMSWITLVGISGSSPCSTDWRLGWT